MKKLILLILLLTACVSLKAQTRPNDLLDTTRLLQQLKSVRPYAFKQIAPQSQLQLNTQPFETLNNRPAQTGITYSQLDHMPTVALVSADRMPVAKGQQGEHFTMPILKLGDIRAIKPQP